MKSDTINIILAGLFIGLGGYSACSGYKYFFIQNKELVGKQMAIRGTNVTRFTIERIIGNRAYGYYEDDFGQIQWTEIRTEFLTESKE